MINRIKHKIRLVLFGQRIKGEKVPEIKLRTVEPKEKITLLQFKFRFNHFNNACHESKN